MKKITDLKVRSKEEVLESILSDFLADAAQAYSIRAERTTRVRGQPARQ